MKTLFSLATLVLALTLTPSSYVGDANGGSDRLPSPQRLGPILFLPSSFARNRPNPSVSPIVEPSFWKNRVLLDGGLRSGWPDSQMFRHDSGVLGYGGGGNTVWMQETSHTLSATSMASPSLTEKQMDGARHHALLVLLAAVTGETWLALQKMSQTKVRCPWIWVSKSIRRDCFSALILAQFLGILLEIAWFPWVVKLLFDGGPSGRVNGGMLTCDGEGVDDGRGAALGILDLGPNRVGQTAGPVLRALGNGLINAISQKLKMKEECGLGLFIKSLGSCEAHFTKLLGPISLWTGQRLCSPKSPSPTLKGKGKI